MMLLSIVQISSGIFLMWMSGFQSDEEFLNIERLEKYRKEYLDDQSENDDPRIVYIKP